MSNRKLYSKLWALGILCVLGALLASAPALCSDPPEGNCIIITSPLDKDGGNAKPEFRTLEGTVAGLKLNPGDEVRVQVVGVTPLLYKLTVTLEVKPVPPSTGGIDFFLGKNLGGETAFEQYGPPYKGMETAPQDARKAMEKLATTLVATVVTKEAELQATGTNSARPAGWCADLKRNCTKKVLTVVGAGPEDSISRWFTPLLESARPTPYDGDAIVSAGECLLKDMPANEKVSFLKRVTRAARIYDRVLAMDDSIVSEPIKIPEGNADCDVKVALVPVGDIEGEPLAYYSDNGQKKLATYSKSYSVSQGEGKPGGGTAGVIFSLIKDGSYAKDETTNTIVSRGDTDRPLVAVGYLYHFPSGTTFTTIGVGAVEDKLAYFVGWSSPLGHGDQVGLISLGFAIASVTRLDGVSRGQTWTEDTVPTKKVFRCGLAGALSIQF